MGSFERLSLDLLVVPLNARVAIIQAYDRSDSVSEGFVSKDKIVVVKKTMSESDNEYMDLSSAFNAAFLFWWVIVQCAW